MNIAVLAGGGGAEREVSLNSGKNVAKALIERGHAVALIDPVSNIPNGELEFFNDSSRIEYRFEHDGVALNAAPPINVINLLRKCDAVFPVLHGSWGEDGRLQAALELFGIPFCGSAYTACALAMDKILTKKLLAEAGILTPQYTVCTKKRMRLPPKYPCVVKPANGGSSVGVSIVFRPFELPKALEKAFLYCDAVLMETEIVGRELTVGILENEALAVTEIKPAVGFYDYENKYIPGKTEEVTPAELSSDVTSRALSIAKRSHDALGLRNYSRVDMMLEEATGLLYVLEVNALPGMTETSLLPQSAAACGIGFSELCERMMKL